LGRIAATLLVLGLIGGTAAAFAVTNGLKHERSPLSRTEVLPKAFSPICRCSTARTVISFDLRRADTVTLSVVDSAGKPARLLFAARRLPAGLHAYPWNGRLDDGARAPDGSYKPQVELEDADRVLTLPSATTIDTKPPIVKVLGVKSTAHGIAVRYTVDEPAHALLFVGRTRVVVTYRKPLRGSVSLSNLALSKRHLRGPVFLAARDPAGNGSKRVPTGKTVG